MAFKKDSIYPESILGLLREDEKGDSKSMIEINRVKQSHN